jgi:CubicO group peptidase (beta-lactamase class C family)
MKIKILTVIILISCHFGFSQNIDSIDSLITESIKLKVFPGAQIYIKKNDFVYNKSYGFHTYDSIIKIENDHLYDLASITKTIAGSLAIMKLVEDYDFDINSPIKKYFKDFKRSELGESKIIDLLSHTAGWQPYINHPKFLIKKNGNLKKRFISDEKKSNNMSLSKKLYVKNSFYNQIKKRIKKTTLNKVGKYKYSNYKLTFNPYKNHTLKKIVPTEIDQFFRQELVHGNVHDETSALMGGISANSGLFSSAESLANLLFLLTLENSILINSNILKNFTQNQIKNDTLNQRGLGFDKVRFVSNGSKIYPHHNLSKDSFGHTGFTGTMYWIDPENDLIFVLLTNSVYPSREKNKLVDLKVREKLLEIIL